MLRVVVALATAHAVVGASTTFYNDATVPVKWSAHYDTAGGASAIFEPGVDDQLVPAGAYSEPHATALFQSGIFEPFSGEPAEQAKYTPLVTTVKLSASVAGEDSEAHGWRYDGNYDVVARDNDAQPEWGVDLFMKRQNKDQTDIKALIPLEATIYAGVLYHIAWQSVCFHDVYAAGVTQLEHAAKYSLA